MASRMKKQEWWGLLAISGTIDLVQLMADLFLSEAFAIPEIVSEVADPVIGGLLVAYFQIRGVSVISRPNRLLSLLGITGVEELTGGAAPAWILDVWYIWSDVKKEEAELQAKKEQEDFLQVASRQPLNQAGPDGMGVRMPTRETADGHIAPAPSRMEQHPAPSKMLNFNGVRRSGS